MSSGPFVISRYQTDSGNVHPARVQPETITAFNPAPTGAVNSPASANMKGGRRRNGVNARQVYGKWVTPPSGYLSTGRVAIPILTQTAWGSINKGDSLTYLGGTFQVTGKRPEYVN